MFETRITGRGSKSQENFLTFRILFERKRSFKICSARPPWTNLNSSSQSLAMRHDISNVVNEAVIVKGPLQFLERRKEEKEDSGYSPRKSKWITAEAASLNPICGDGGSFLPERGRDTPFLPRYTTIYYPANRAGKPLK